MEIECGFFSELNRTDWVLKLVVKVNHGFKEQILWHPGHGRISGFVFHETFCKLISIVSHGHIFNPYDDFT